MEQQLLADLQLSAAFFEQFDLEQVIGEGGMGLVVKGVQKALCRPVAIKFLRADYSAHDPMALRRFVDEGKICSSLAHPNIVRLYLCGRDSLLYAVYELIDGQSLEGLLRSSRGGRLSIARGTAIALDVCAGMGYAHEMGVVHRDIKPANILVEAATGTAKVADFGIARTGVTGARTKTGIVVGTPTYMAPEQVRGERNLDARTDVYSLCAMLYEVYCGRPPYPGVGIDVVRHHVDPNSRPLDISQVQPSIPRSLGEVIHRGLEYEQSKRWANAAALRKALAAVAALRGSSSVEEGPAVTMALSDHGGAQHPVSEDTAPRRASQRVERTVPGKSARNAPGRPPRKSAAVMPASVPGHSEVTSATTSRWRYAVATVIVVCLGLLGLFALVNPLASEPVLVEAVEVVMAGKQVEIKWRLNTAAKTDIVELTGCVDWQQSSKEPAGTGRLHVLRGQCRGIKGPRLSLRFGLEERGAFSVVVPLPQLELELPARADGSAIMIWRQHRFGQYRYGAKRDVVAPFAPTETRLPWPEPSIVSNDVHPLLTETYRYASDDCELLFVARALPVLGLERNRIKLRPPSAATERDVTWGTVAAKSAKVITIVNELQLAQSFAALFKRGVKLGAPLERGRVTGPSFLQPGSAQWTRLRDHFAEWERGVYGVAVAASLVNPLESPQRRRKLRESIDLLRLALARMVGQSLSVDTDPFWTPRGDGVRASDTVGFWVPTVGLERAMAPLVSLRALHSSKLFEEYRAGLELLVREPPTDVTPFAGLLLSRNLQREYAFGLAGADYLPGKIAPFADMKKDSISVVAVERLLSLPKKRPRRGYVRLFLQTHFLDVLCTIRCSIGKRVLYLIPDRCNDLNEFVLASKMATKTFAEIPFDPDHEELYEEPIGWIIDLPAVWFGDAVHAITFECMCLGLPDRIGKNKRTISLPGFGREGIPFINMAVVGPVSCGVLR